ncbi:MAG: glycosyl hydrolase family 18 [Pseudobutyrivibrio sp.]|nr:glycosyl hydrolase family 18 [Pseudobutyrivibrio sp.]
MSYQNHNYRNNNTRHRRKKKKSYVPRGYKYIAAAILAIGVIAVGIYGIRKYAPTKEHLPLTEYFKNSYENEAAVILNGEYLAVGEDATCPNALISEGQIYLELGFVKDNIDSGYVYDPTEITLRYATDKEIYSATLGSTDYSIDKSNNSLTKQILVAQNDTVFISTEFLALLSDFQCNYYDKPDRVVIETVGYKKQVADAKRNGQIRKLNGPKSPILEDVKKGEKLNVVRDTGRWSFVVSDKGVCGYMKNNQISDLKSEKVEATLPERTYNHISFGKEVNLIWHQVKNRSYNAEITDVVATSPGINVISPTWFYMDDNKGGIASLASNDYVSFCHSNNIQVWGLFSNFENKDIDSAVVFNTTSSRDALVNNLIAQAITYGLDGINVDVEELNATAADGYVQFLKELSIKCEKNDIILSVDDYVPAPHNGIYNRPVQAKYADYVIIMGYDEYFSGSEEPGPVASIGWVDKGVKDTLEKVPAEQVILGMPFYCRVWHESETGSLSSKAYGIDAVQSFLATNEATASWDDEKGLNYAEFSKGNSTYYVWVEDEKSLEEKLKVMDKYNLAGGAFWKKGFDNSGVWNVIAKYL